MTPNQVLYISACMYGWMYVLMHVRLKKHINNKQQQETPNKQTNQKHTKQKQTQTKTQRHKNNNKTIKQYKTTTNTKQQTTTCTSEASLYSKCLGAEQTTSTQGNSNTQAARASCAVTDIGYLCH